MKCGNWRGGELAQVVQSVDRNISGFTLDSFGHYPQVFLSFERWFGARMPEDMVLVVMITTESGEEGMSLSGKYLS